MLVSMQQKLCSPVYLASVPPDHFLCLGGDFNCTLNPSLDRNRAEPHVASTRSLVHSISRFKLTDIWRLQHPTQQQFTWCRCSNNLVSLARLDKFYVSDHFLNLVLNTSILPSGFSDHHVVVMQFQLPFVKVVSPYWKFNAALLQNKFFVSSFKTFCAHYITMDQDFSCLRQW